MSDPLRSLLCSFANHDRNADGDAAIESVSYIDFEDHSELPPADGRFVVVFVEHRLLAEVSGSPHAQQEFRSCLLRFKGDLRAEGFFSRFVDARVYAGDRHQDGRTLLALRELVRRTRLLYPNLQGAVLVGSFPEAMIVRQWIWRTERDVTVAGQLHQDAEHLRIVPEIVAHRADLVLADIDGNWQDLYLEGPTQVDAVEALPAASMGNVWPQNGQTFVSDVFNEFAETFEDFFLVDDADWTQLASAPGQLRVLIRTTGLHPELNAADRALPNPVARPNIAVSRIDARHVAAGPDMAVAPWLDAAGRPQSYPSGTNVGTGAGSWVHDPALERSLLIKYFDRNHRFRVGAYSDLPFRASTVGEEFDAGAMLAYLQKASSDFAPGFAFNDATLVDYVVFLAEPATLRGVHAHADQWGTRFADDYQTTDLEAAVGGHPWRWRRDGGNYVPSLADQHGKADLFLHRTIWENNVMRDSGAAIWVHGGCLANSPGHAHDRSYDDSDYGIFQNAEGILFYLNAVAVFARAKVFNDLPAGLPSALATTPRTPVGDAWRTTFNVEAGDAQLAKRPADCKRVYNWSVLGDWTVRVRNENGLGVLRFGHGLTSQAVHPNRAWIGRWNYQSDLNTVEAVGDVDGDGKDEFVITSAWGIGVLGHDGQRWRDLLVAPNDTWFGAWRYNASVNPGDDRLHGLGRFSTSARSDLLLTSNWGIGVLTWDGQTLTSAIAEPNGSRFGGWWYDSRSSTVERISDFDDDGRDEILISSDWGLGVLDPHGDRFTAIMMAPNGTSFGGWALNTHRDRFYAPGNLTGLGGDDIVITSPWGIGLFTLSQGTLEAWFIAPNGTRFGDWIWNSDDNAIVGAGDVDGDGRAEIVVTSPWGMTVLEPRGPRFHPIVTVPNGAVLNGWRWNSADNRVVAVSDVDGDGRDEIVVTSPWGVGVLGFTDDHLAAKSLIPHDGQVGEWVSKSDDRWIGTGDFSGGAARELLIQKPR